MARPRTEPDAGKDPHRVQAEAVEEQTAAEEEAEEKRERERERVASGRGVPDDSEAPTVIRKRSGDTEYSLDRLIAESHAFLGHPSYVAAGAFHGYGKAYISLDEAQERVDAWLDRPIPSATSTDEEEEAV